MRFPSQEQSLGVNLVHLSLGPHVPSYRMTRERKIHSCTDPSPYEYWLARNDAIGLRQSHFLTLCPYGFIFYLYDSIIFGNNEKKYFFLLVIQQSGLE